MIHNDSVLGFIKKFPLALLEHHENARVSQEKLIV